MIKLSYNSSVNKKLMLDVIILDITVLPVTLSIFVAQSKIVLNDVTKEKNCES